MSARAGQLRSVRRATQHGPEAGRSRRRPVLWALAFSALSAVGLGALAWAILVAHGLMYGFFTVFSPQLIETVDPDRYRLAFVLGLIVAFSGAASLAWLAVRTPARRWPPPVQGFTAALLAGMAGASALLLTLGINPIDFVASMWG